MAPSSPGTSKYKEVERKFEVVESTVSPSFQGLSSVARVERSPSQQLDAVYFDTPGRDLAAHDVTLRRRTGGADATCSASCSNTGAHTLPGRPMIS